MPSIDPPSDDDREDDPDDDRDGRPPSDADSGPDGNGPPEGPDDEEGSPDGDDQDRGSDDESPTHVPGGYRDRSEREHTIGAPDAPDPNEPLDLDLETTPAGGSLGGGSDGDEGGDGQGTDGDARAEGGIFEEDDVGDRPDTGDDQAADADDEDGAGERGESSAAEAAAGDVGSATTGSGRVSGTAIGSPASSDAMLDEVGEAESLSRPEQLAEGVVDMADQAGSETERGTSTLDLYAYRRFGPWVRRQQGRFAEYRQLVNEARLDETYDEYLARVILWSLLFAGAGAVMGVMFATALVQTGVVYNISLNIPSLPVSPSTAELLTAPVTYLVASTAGAVALGVTTAAVLYDAPRRRARQREREIDYLLPQTVTYMYALSQGQLSIPAIIRQVAGDEATYGEVAREFQTVVNEMDFHGRDLRAALRAARDGTPSEDLAILLDDMINVESTGGKLSPFFKDKVEQYQYEARRQKRKYLDTLEQFAELYVTIAAAIVFVVTIAAVYVSITGNGVMFLAVFLYVAVPALSLGGYVMVDSVSLAALATTETLRRDTNHDLSVDDIAARLNGRLPSGAEADAAVADGGTGTGTARVRSRTTWTTDELSPIVHSRLESLRTALRRQRVIRTLRAPLRRVNREPLLSLWLTAPVVLVYLVGVVATGLVSITPSAFVDHPAWTTTATVVVPALILGVPVSWFHERDRRRTQKANKQLPGILRKLAAATDSGATLSGAIAIVADSSDTYLARELERAHIESSVWNVPRSEALVRMTDRVRNPRLARVVQLINEAAGSTQYLRDILEIAATDVRTAHRLEEDRKADMQKYMFIIAFANLVFLAISIVLAVFIVPRMNLSSQVDPEVVQSASGPTAALLFGETPPVSLIKMFFMHGALILATSSGLLAGKLGYDDTLAGLKISLAKITLTAIVFLLV